MQPIVSTGEGRKGFHPPRSPIQKRLLGRWVGPKEWWVGFTAHQLGWTRKKTDRPKPSLDRGVGPAVTREEDDDAELRGSK